KSGTVLATVRHDLLERYRATEVTTDVNSALLPFARGMHIDVVPAVFKQFLENIRPKSPVYLIPKGGGKWMESCPDAHNRFVREANRRSTGKLRRVAQILKFWCRQRTQRVPISSFHIEV